MKTTNALTDGRSPSHPGSRPGDVYGALLRATGRLRSPHSAAAFVILTTFLAPHNLTGAVRVSAGRLLVPAGGGRRSERSVPLSDFTLQVLGGGDGVVMELLGLTAQGSGSFLQEFGLALEEVREDYSAPEVRANFTMERLRAAAVWGVIGSAGSSRLRSAVLAYSGISGRSQLGNTEADLLNVAALIDTAVEAAGFVAEDRPRRVYRSALHMAEPAGEYANSTS